MKRFGLLGVLAAATALFGAAAQGPANGPDAGAQGYEEPPIAAQLIVFSQRGYGGDVRELYDVTPTLRESYFNDRPRSLAVLGGVWEVCEDRDFTGKCAIVRQDVYDLRRIGLDRRITSARPIYEYTDAPHALLFERDRSGYIRYADHYGYYDRDYRYSESRVRTDVYVHYGHTPHYRRYGYYDPGLGHGPYGYGYGRPTYGHHHKSYHHRRSLPPLKGHYGARNGAATIYTDSRQGGASLGLNRAVPDLSRYRFNDNASSIDIRSGKWELCEHANYQGRCQIVDASKERLNGLRLNDNVSSIRPVEGTLPPGTGRRGGRRGGDAGMRDDRGQGQGRGQGMGQRQDRGERGRDQRGSDALVGGPIDGVATRGGRNEIRRGVRRNQPVSTPRRATMPRANQTPRPATRSAPRNAPRANAPRNTPRAAAPRTNPRAAAPRNTPRAAAPRNTPRAAPAPQPQRRAAPRPQQPTRAAPPPRQPQAAPRRPGGHSAGRSPAPSTARQRPGRQRAGEGRREDN